MKRQIGFTLVELAVVVFLVGILATMGIAALNTQLTSSAISATQRKESVLQDALMNYLRLNNRLPCPAVADITQTPPVTGLESRTTSATAGNFDCGAPGKAAPSGGAFGIIPYATLGLPQSAALDGWNNFFSYAVSPLWTLTYSAAAPVAGGTTTNVPANAFNVGNLGALSVNNRVPATNSTPTSVTTTAVAVIISHSINGLGAFTSKGTQNAPPMTGTDEYANTPNSTTWAAPAAFYQRDYTNTSVPTYGAFDDIVLWLSANDLLTPLMKDGAIQSAQAQWATQITQINNALIGAMFTNSYCAPIASSSFQSLLTANGISSVDPWGYTVTYTPTPLFCRLNSNGTYKTSSCGSGCGTCITPSSSFAPFTVTTTPTNPNATIQPQILRTIIAANPGLLSNCPSP